MLLFVNHCKRLLRYVAAGLLLAVCASPSLAEVAQYDDAAALKDLELARSVFLIDFTNPKKTAFYLDIIKGTHDSLLRQNVKSDMVLVFIGQTVQYLTTEPDDELDMQYGEQLRAIARSAEELKQRGVRMEVCAVATGVFGVDNARILPSMEVVGDGFISLIGWQSQGHKLVPIF